MLSYSSAPGWLSIGRWIGSFHVPTGQSPIRVEPRPPWRSDRRKRRRTSARRRQSAPPERRSESWSALRPCKHWSCPLAQPETGCSSRWETVRSQWTGRVRTGGTGPGGWSGRRSCPLWCPGRQRKSELLRVYSPTVSASRSEAWCTWKHQTIKSWWRIWWC